MKAAKRKAVLVFSDPHCGSIYGLLPPDFLASDDKIINQNPGQRYLWQCWEHLSARVAGIDIAAVVANGDIVDGGQRLQNGSELALPLIADQAMAAERCLQYLKRHTGEAKWYFVQGTEYHDSKAGREVEAVAKTLGATQYKGAGTGSYSRQVLDLEVDGVVLNFSHGISVSGGLYRTTSPDREGVWSALAGKEGKLPKADAVIRSHAHYFVHVEHEDKHIVITPCWELQTGYMRKNSVYRMLPSLGAIIVWVDGAKKKEHEDPIEIEKILYRLPPVQTTKL